MTGEEDYVCGSTRPAVGCLPPPHPLSPSSSSSVFCRSNQANARNKVSLKDDSYKPVAAAAAEAKVRPAGLLPPLTVLGVAMSDDRMTQVIGGFMHAEEVVEASKWLKEQDILTTVLAVDETVILLQPPLPLVGVSIWMERGCQQNDSLVNG